jgi:glycosyltransferase involved in cell wall biosynthesis/O-antigen/teichoic acid export membrane protein
LSNFALGVLVARQVSAREFGAFALSFALYGYLVTVSRQLVSQPLAVRFSGAEPTDFTRAARQSAGAAIVVALPPAIALFVTGVALGDTIGWTLATTAGLLPGLLLQDSWRMIFLAFGRPSSAAANDAAWGIVQFVLLLALSAVGSSSALVYLLAWGLSGWLAAALGIAQAGFLPAPRAALEWLKAHWDLTRYFVTELVAINGSTQLMLVLVAALGGLSVAGALRGAQVLTGPVTILLMSGMAFAIPELARRPWIVGRRLVRIGIGISGAVVAISAVWGALLLILPADVGRSVMGDTWTGVDAILVPTVVGMILSVAGLGAACGIQAVGRPKVLFRLQLVAAPAFLIGGVVGVLAGGAFGAAVGIALALALNAGVSWIRFVVVARKTAGASRTPNRTENSDIPRPLSILMFVDTFADTGSLRWVHELSKHWLKTGSAVAYFSLKPGVDGKRPLLMPPAGTSLTYGDTVVRRFRKALPIALFRAVRAATSSDVVFAAGELGLSIPFGYVVARLARRPFVVYAQSILNHVHPSRLERSLWRYCLTRADAVLCVSPATVDSAVRLGIKPSRITLAPTGIDVDSVRQRGWANDTGRAPGSAQASIVACGELESRKGYDILVRVLARVLGTGRQVRLILIGEGPEGPALERLAHDLGVSHAITFLGHVENPLPEIARGAAFVHCARIEAVGLVLLEALTLGVPMIAADCAAGGPRMVLNGGKFGRLVEPESVSAMADAICAHLDSPAQLAHQASQAEPYLRHHFQPGRTAAIILDALTQL